MRRRGITTNEVIGICMGGALVAVGLFAIFSGFGKGSGGGPGGAPDYRIELGRNRPGCLSHVRQIGLAIRMYGNQYRNHLPRATHTRRPDRREVLGSLGVLFKARYLDNPEVLMCPSDTRATGDPFEPARFDPRDPSTYPTRSNCSYSMDLDVMLNGDPSTAILSDEPEGASNSANHRMPSGSMRGRGPESGQNRFRLGGDATFISSPANRPDPNIFQYNRGVDNDAFIRDLDP